MNLTNSSINAEIRAAFSTGFWEDRREPTVGFANYLNPEDKRRKYLKIVPNIAIFLNDHHNYCSGKL